MNKYSIERLDKRMIFNHSILNTLCCELPILLKRKRVDEFEFSFEIVDVTVLDSSHLEYILKKIISFCSNIFWKHINFKIDEIITTDITIDRSKSLMMDFVLIKSNQNEIFIEVFIYQKTTNLHSMILISKNTESIEPKESHIPISKFIKDNKELTVMN